MKKESERIEALKASLAYAREQFRLTSTERWAVKCEELFKEIRGLEPRFEECSLPFPTDEGGSRRERGK